MKKSGYTPFKMKGKSPMMKKLIGNQHRLPEELKAKILASPTKMMKKSPAKQEDPNLIQKQRSKINPFSQEFRSMTPKQKKDLRAGGKTKKGKTLRGAGKKKITAANVRESLGNTKKKVEGKLNTLNKSVQGEAEKLDKFLKKPKTIKVAEKLKLPKKGENTSSRKNDDNKGDGKIPWKTVPAVGSKARTKWYKKYNLKLDDTTPALMKKSAAKMKKAPAKMKKAAVKMKKSPAKLIKRKTDREKLNKLVEKRTKLNKKKDEREAKGKKTKRVTRRIERTQNKINKNPKAQEDRKNAPKEMTKQDAVRIDERGIPRPRRTSRVKGTRGGAIRKPRARR